MQYYSVPRILLEVYAIMHNLQFTLRLHYAMCTVQTDIWSLGCCVYELMTLFCYINQAKFAVSGMREVSSSKLKERSR